tara:strand:- start:808 stop:1293 length:486 start_codon:yes stop_codon:yes gene_type:complete
LIEKAWAKLCGNYDRISKGTLNMGFIHLCGVPTVTYNHESNTKFWSRLLLAEEARYIMTCACTNDISQGLKLHYCGLKTGNCYLILKIIDVKGHKILKLKNIWGTQTWNGKGCNSEDPFWTKELIEECNPDVWDEGEFFILYEDYLQHFSTTTICKYSNLK